MEVLREWQGGKLLKCWERGTREGNDSYLCRKEKGNYQEEREEGEGCGESGKNKV